ncbi:glycoside hydrolase family 15 protein [Amycolatopsis sp. H20-H5]|uniref:glycoside hydrolase family 15 protein n=1 Tax=Amycolatopsis sp. H20-H5 TaxID=3046309 RepID=UPI002DBF6D19|nr:glycoside hydrolase family 15 protein [Amycolatopsis sp. H20-H5]MEC3981517.1 glycoside hydrolase family 15 protein [Amycolatopsis sp. H20-H5]
MRRFMIPALVGLLVSSLIPATAAASGGGEAPGGPGVRPSWLPANKTGFGTARDRASNVWFTLQGGQLSEVYYPDLSTPSVRALNLVVSDGRSFASVDSAARAQQVRRTSDDGLTYEQTITDDQHRWKLRKTYVTDPARSTVLIDVDFTSLTGRPYRLYAVADPDLTNDGSDDTAAANGATLLSHDAKTAAALTAQPAFEHASVGYAGVSDGLTQLTKTFGLKDYASAAKGNVLLTGQTTADGVRSRHVTLALGMGAKDSDALGNAKASQRQGFRDTARAYDAGWRGYLRTVSRVPSSVKTKNERDLYQASVLMLAASEDKTHPGAFVASPSMPWRFGNNDPAYSPSGTYHLVWPRDLYQIATGLLAAGDRGAANRSLDYMFGTQQLPDGHLPQNTNVDGKPYWPSVQLDETAFPIVLAQQLGRTDAKTWQGVRKAAEFLLSYKGENGLASPYTQQERWEEQDGYSPSTIASVIAGLVCAADLAKHNGAAADAQRYLAAADKFKADLTKQTVTTNGPLSKDPYFVRLTKDGNANAGTKYNLGNSSLTKDQREVTDAGFLDLVRLGVYAADDPVIRNSIKVTDAQIGFTTPKGQFWHRYTLDGYGEQPDGSPWDYTFPAESRATYGRLWPLLAGERGEYDLANGDHSSAARRLRDLGRVSSSGDTMPEQVWDENAPSSQTGFPPGTPTASATPLAWTHAQYVRLAWNVQRGAVTEQPAVVRCHFLGC